MFDERIFNSRIPALSIIRDTVVVNYPLHFWTWMLSCKTKRMENFPFHWLGGRKCTYLALIGLLAVDVVGMIWMWGVVEEGCVVAGWALIVKLDDLGFEDSAEDKWGAVANPVPWCVRDEWKVDLYYWRRWLNNAWVVGATQVCDTVLRKQVFALLGILKQCGESFRTRPERRYSFTEELAICNTCTHVIVVLDCRGMD